MSAEQQAARVAWFVDSIRGVMPDAAPVREALSFVQLVMLHPCCPPDLVALYESLWSVADLCSDDPTKAATRLRAEAQMALTRCNHTPSGHVLENALMAKAVPFDDTVTQRMLLVDLGLRSAGVEVVVINEATPIWKGGASPGFLMSPELVRPWVQPHIAHVCGMAWVESRRTAARFSGWSCSDLEGALLALRMNYSIFRTPLEGSSVAPADLVRDFEGVGAEIWWQLRDAIASRAAESRLCALPHTAKWHIQTRSSLRHALSSSRAETSEATELEPETACRHTDIFLKTECDFSGVMWIATANALSSIQVVPLVSRLRVLMLHQPEPHHYPVIAENVLVEIARRWTLDRWALPQLTDLALPFDQLTSARQVRVAAEAAVTEWARALQRH